MLGFLKRLLSGEQSPKAAASAQDDEVAHHKGHTFAEMGKDAGVSSGDIMAAMGRQAMVGGKPVYDYAQSHKHDIDMMLECCRAIESVYWAHTGYKLGPEPAYFERAAILSRKAKDYSGEVAICERWIEMADDFQAWLAENPKVRVADVTKGPRSMKIYERLPKAKELLANQEKAQRGES